MWRSTFVTTLCLALACSLSGDLSGTITESDTGAIGCIISGYALRGDSTPVANADALLHDQRLVAGRGLTKRLDLIRSGRTTTDSSGFFHFDSVDTGRFLVELNDHDSLGAIVQADVDTADTLLWLDGTLRPHGCIVGFIDTSVVHGYGDPMLVVLPEIGRVAEIDSGGRFVIAAVPEWSYVIRLAAGDSIVESPLDTLLVEVSPSDTARVRVEDTTSRAFPADSQVIHESFDSYANGLSTLPVPWTVIFSGNSSGCRVTDEQAFSPPLCWRSSDSPMWARWDGMAVTRADYMRFEAKIMLVDTAWPAMIGLSQVLSASQAHSFFYVQMNGPFYEPGRWYDVRAEIDCVNDTSQVWIDGVPLGRGFWTDQTDEQSITHFHFGTQNHAESAVNGTVYYDDIRLWVSK